MFQVGQKVVCIDDAPPPWSDQRIWNGRIYTITWINPRTGGFALAEATAEPQAISFARRRFRPVVERKTDISIFTKMLTPNTREIERVQ